MSISKYKNIYFVGIGGIGMSALARWFKLLNFNVAGYDKTKSAITSELEDIGISISFEDNINRIPMQFRNNSNTLVVYTPAVPSLHTQLVWFRNNNFNVVKRAELLGLISKSYKNIAVAGTHGKTSVSTLIAYIFEKSSHKTNALLGGISVNYNSNLIHSSNSDKLVVEADEFDRSFLHLSPETAVITHIDPDHLDIYGSYDELLKTFLQFSANIEDGGKLFYNIELSKYFDNSGKFETYSYSSINTESDFFAEILDTGTSGTKFNLHTPTGIVKNLKLPQVGLHHIENAVAAISVALSYGLNENEIRKSLLNYKGVKRRYEFIAKNNNITYIDDYAHHPKELKVTIEALRTQFPKSYITGVFQPHLFSRTRDFADDFAEELSKLDELILLEIYPARELPIQGIDSKFLLSKIELENKKLLNKEELIRYIESDLKKGVLITIGAGDIDRLVEPIKKILLK
jgi:UDP-N-acetylmuramate--alanine ligase